MLASGFPDDSVSISGSPGSSPEIPPAHLSDDGESGDSDDERTFPIPESRDLLNMYTNVEIGAVASMDRRDQCLTSLAEIKRTIAKAEKRLAYHRKHEMVLLYRFHVIQEELAGQRLSQADINLDRTKYYTSHTCERPRLVRSPVNIMGSLSRPSVPVEHDIGSF